MTLEMPRGRTWNTIKNNFAEKKVYRNEILLFRSGPDGNELVLELQNQSVSIFYYYLEVVCTISESE